ncbi:hypothetical protein ABI59_18130 [Acidobacteria bacterium Mor1]|nr:hypothetical protein ABI59_18130 [Acidobacteria bacterium Mor1]
MSRECIRFAEWVGRETVADAGERYGYLRHAVGCETCRRELTEAVALGSLLSGPASGPRGEVDPAVLAESLSSGRVPAESLHSVESLEWTLASIESLGPEVEQTAAEGTYEASATTRRRLRRLAVDDRSRGGGSRWVPALAAAAAMILAVLFLWNARQSGGARLAGLEDWREPYAAALDGRGFAGESLFEIPAGDGSVVRSGPAGELSLEPLEPRWEAVAATPAALVVEVRGQGSPRRLEVLLVDAARELVWSGEQEVAGGPLRVSTGDLQLVPGERYFWRVQADLGGDLIASPFVGFELLAEDRAREYERLRELSREEPLMAAVISDRFGLYGEAVRFLEASSASPEVVEAGLAALAKKRGVVPAP